MRRAIIELREVVQKLVPMLTGKGLEVTQRGTQAYVSVNARTKKPERVNIPNISDNASDDFIRAIQGFIDHEVAHVLITDWDCYGGDPAPTENDLKDPKVRRLMNMHNITEDTMIEREIVKIFPGARRNIADLREHFIRKITKPAVEAARSDKERFNYLLVPLMRALAGHKEFEEFMDAEGYWSDPMIDGVVKALKPETIKLLRECTTTRETLVVAEELIDILHKAEPPEQEHQQSGGQSQDKPEKQAGEGDGDGERDHSEKAEEGDEQDDSEQGDAGESSDDGDAEDGDDDGDDSAAGQDGDEPDGDADGENAGSGDADDDAEDDGEGASDSGEGSDEGGSESSGDDADDAGDGDEAGDASGDAGDDDDGSDASGGSSDSEQSDASGDSGVGDDGTREGAGNTDGTQDSAGIDGESVDESSGGGYGDGLGKSMFDYDDDAFEGASLGDMIAGEISKEAVEAMRVSDWTAFTRDFDRIEHLRPPEHMNQKWVPEMEEDVRSMVGPMQKDIERIMAARSQVVNIPGQRRGRLHSPSLYRVSQGDPRVFTQRQEHTSKDTAVMLLIDNSGSMHGEKMRLAMISGYALSVTLDRVNIAHEVVGFTTGDFRGVPQSVLDGMHDEITHSDVSFDRLSPLVMPIYKSFDDRLDADMKKRMAYAMNAQDGLRTNIDGESLLIAAERMAPRMEKRKVMMVLSDGRPCGGQRAGAHLKATVKMLNENGIETIGIGIKDSNVSRYYDNHTVLNSAEELPKRVMGEIKKILA